MSRKDCRQCLYSYKQKLLLKAVLSFKISLSTSYERNERTRGKKAGVTTLSLDWQPWNNSACFNALLYLSLLALVLQWIIGTARNCTATDVQQLLSNFCVSWMLHFITGVPSAKLLQDNQVWKKKQGFFFLSAVSFGRLEHLWLCYIWLYPAH